MITGPLGNELKIVKTYNDDEGRIVAVDAELRDNHIFRKVVRYDIEELSATHGPPEIYAAMCDLPSEERTFQEDECQ